MTRPFRRGLARGLGLGAGRAVGRLVGRVVVWGLIGLVLLVALAVVR